MLQTGPYFPKYRLNAPHKHQSFLISGSSTCFCWGDFGLKYLYLHFTFLNITVYLNNVLGACIREQLMAIMTHFYYIFSVCKLLSVSHKMDNVSSTSPLVMKILSRANTHL